MSARNTALSDFIASAPPGELNNVITAIKTLSGDPNVTSTLGPALQKYNEDQFTAVKLPGASQPVIVSSYNRLEDGRYFDVESKSSWTYDHIAQKASNVQSYVPDSPHDELIKSLYKSLSKHVSEHYPSASLGIYPSSDGVHILTVSSKYSPSNFYNGRFRSHYIYSPSSNQLRGTITVDVHYYEDGNVRLLTNKKIDETVRGDNVAGTIAAAERKYQEELNRGFSGLSEGAFRGLRRQLPVTRVKVDWEKVSGYRLGQDIGGTRR
ncbi:uncharacterized protein PV09_04492 [Verruconis gallopava]|uniref:F-actin-capping protein subunit alpha n=1 Tax=Verruconis gallopava TaxID=253628 RepID=A0A0D2AYD5_9PEZI|nr:uncharacterized protein PV09_04492 [Verruconis gallopava]KIW04179.1 hypothetical protein PV09_04492 [Verruconis gallopava]